MPWCRYFSSCSQTDQRSCPPEGGGGRVCGAEAAGAACWDCGVGAAVSGSRMAISTYLATCGSRMAWLRSSPPPPCLSARTRASISGSSMSSSSPGNSRSPRNECPPRLVREGDRGQGLRLSIRRMLGSLLRHRSPYTPPIPVAQAGQASHSRRWRVRQPGHDLRRVGRQLPLRLIRHCVPKIYVAAGEKHKKGRRREGVEGGGGRKGRRGWWWRVE
jgi:hypothetical protein